jgi:ProP effector
MSKNPDPRIIIGILAEKFPRTFFVNGSQRRPLKIGILEDLTAAEAKLSKSKIRLAVRVYTSSIGYLSAMHEGTDRIDLAGEVAGVVTEDEALHARKKQAAHSASAGTSVGPKKLGLADLKQAWQRRQAKQGAA